MRYSFVKDKFVKESEAKISIKDRGLRFGDGVFETIRVKQGQVRDLKLHLARLKNGLMMVKIRCSILNIETIVKEAVKKNKLQDGFVRVMVTRGEGSHGYLPLKTNSPSLIVEVFDAPNMNKTDYELCVSRYQKPSINSLPVNYKIMQGLNSTLAKIDATENGFDDAILLNEKGKITETTSANLFFMDNGRIYTPIYSDGLLVGVTREKIMHKFKVKEKSISIKRLSDFDLIFMTNVAIEAKRVASITGDKKALWVESPKKKSLQIYEYITQYLD